MVQEKNERVSWCNHALLRQLMRRSNLTSVYWLDVGDGLKEIRALSKPPRSSSLLHTSATFKEVLQSEFEAVNLRSFQLLLIQDGSQH